MPNQQAQECQATRHRSAKLPGSGHQTTRHRTVPSYQAQDSTKPPGSGHQAAGTGLTGFALSECQATRLQLSDQQAQECQTTRLRPPSYQALHKCTRLRPPSYQAPAIRPAGTGVPDHQAQAISCRHRVDRVRPLRVSSYQAPAIRPAGIGVPDHQAQATKLPGTA